MSKNKIQDGKMLDVVLGADTASGELVIQGKKVGVANQAGKAGDTIGIETEGVFKLPKVAADDIGDGAVVYAKADKTITTTASGNTKCGYAEAAAGNGVEFVNVMLFPIV